MSQTKKKNFKIEPFKHKVEMDPKYAEKTWKILEDAIHEIYNHNASGLSFEELYRCVQALSSFLRGAGSGERVSHNYFYIYSWYTSAVVCFYPIGTHRDSTGKLEVLTWFERAPLLPTFFHRVIFSTQFVASLLHRQGYEFEMTQSCKAIIPVKEGKPLVLHLFADGPSICRQASHEITQSDRGDVPGEPGSV